MPATWKTRWMARNMLHGSSQDCRGHCVPLDCSPFASPSRPWLQMDAFMRELEAASKEVAKHYDLSFFIFTFNIYIHK